MEFVWNVDPNLFHLPSWLLNGRGIRYYGVLYACALMGGFYWWRWQMLRGGKTEEQADRFLTMGVIAVIGGARVGHCLFYEPEKYLRDPVRILYFWEGGLASHGTTIAILLTIWWFARKQSMTFREVGDRLSMSVAWSACLVRVGNFMNSEIVGRVTDGPLRVRFPRYELFHGQRDLLRSCDSCGSVPTRVCDYVNNNCYSFDLLPWRHPSQLYEAMLGMGALGVLLVVDRLAGREKRPLGLLFFVLLAVYFSGRFTVEFFKEYQTLTSGLTMGQWLSVPFALAGFVGIYVSLKRREASGGPTGEEGPAKAG